MNKTEIRTILNKKGYIAKVIKNNNLEETEIYINSKINWGVIVAYTYFTEEDREQYLDLFENVKKELNIKHFFLLILDNRLIEAEKDEIKRDEYFFIKIFEEDIDAILDNENKEKDIVFEAMDSIEDKGDYLINPFDYIDGLAIINFLKYLHSVNIKKDNMPLVIKYPKCIQLSTIAYFKYLVNI